MAAFAVSLSLALSLGLAAGGCAPTLPPFVTAETADVLPSKAVGVSLAGGGAVLTTDARTVGLCCSGGEARVRVGVGARQEVSVGAAFASTDDVAAYASRIGWKLAARPWLAVVGGTGGVVHVHTLGKVLAVSADVGLLASTPRGWFSHGQLYGGLRTGVSVPALVDPLSGPGLVAHVAAPLGFALRLGGARVYIEGGAVGTRTWYRAGDVADAYPLVGVYGALAFGVFFE